MKIGSFVELVASGNLRDHLESSLREELEGRRSSGRWNECLPFLQLLRTDVLLDWARESRMLRRALDRDYAEVHSLAALLLERHILHLAYRRKPEMLIEFWKWAARSKPELADLWIDANSSVTLEHREGIRDEEERLARALTRLAARVQQANGPLWAVHSLRRIARSRALLDRGEAENACARVVFAWDGEKPDAFRTGLIVDLKLLGETRDRCVVTDPHVFDRGFHRGLQYVADRLGDRMRQIEHDWGWLGDEVLVGSSGTMAIWLAQRLAAGGVSLDGKRWALPSWVMVTATLDPDGGGTGGAAGPVDLLREKAELLIEEGVRVMVVADPCRSARAQGLHYDQDQAAGQFTDVSGAEDLKIVSVEGDVEALCQEVRKHGYAYPIRLDAVETRLLPSYSPKASQRIRSRQKVRVGRDEYVEPLHFLRPLREQIEELGGARGRGYLHLVADAGMGKSFLVESLKAGWVSESVAPGRTVAWRILHGEPESPAAFLKSVVKQAERLDPDREFDVETRGHYQTWHEMREDLRYTLRVTKRERCHEQPLVLAVDALDELTERETRSPLLLQSLPEADEMPEGCYVLLTSRPHLRPGAQRQLDKLGRQSKHWRTIQVGIEDPTYREVLRAYLRQTLGSHVEPHLHAILHRSRYSFLYVRFQRELIELSRIDLTTLEPGELPEGAHVFVEYLQRLASIVGQETFSQWHGCILALAAAAYTPVSRRHVQFWLGGTWNDDMLHQLNMVLEDLAPIFWEVRNTDQDDSEYIIAHEELLHYLQGRGRPGAFSLADYGHRWIVRASQAHRYSEHADAMDAVDRYHLLHLPSHCQMIGAHEAAVQLLRDPRSAKLFNEWTKRLQSQGQWLEVTRVWHHRAGQLERLLEVQGGEEVVAKEDPEWVHVLATAHMNRGVALDTQQQFTEAMEAYAKAVSLLERLVEFHGEAEVVMRDKPLWVNELAAAHVNRGVALYAQQEFSDAMEAYARAITLRERLVEVQGGEQLVAKTNPEWVNALSTAHMNRGVALDTQQQFPEAMDAYGRAICLRDRLVEAHGGEDVVAKENPQWVIDLATAHMNRGAALDTQQQFTEAMDAYARGIFLWERLLEVQGGEDVVAKANPGWVNALATAHMNRGAALDTQQQFTEAIDAYDRVIFLRERLVEVQGGEELVAVETPEWADELAVAHMQRGMTLWYQQNFRDAMEAYARVISLRKRLVEVQGGEQLVAKTNPEWVNALATAHMNWGAAMWNQQKPCEALNAFDKAILLWERLLEMHGDAEAVARKKAKWVNALAGAHMNRGAALDAQQQFTEAIDAYGSALAVWRQGLQPVQAGGDLLVEALPDMLQVLFNRMSSHLMAGNAGDAIDDLVAGVRCLIFDYQQLGLLIGARGVAEKFHLFDQALGGAESSNNVLRSLRFTEEEIRIWETLRTILREA